MAKKQAPQPDPQPEPAPSPQPAKAEPSGSAWTTKILGRWSEPREWGPYVCPKCRGRKKLREDQGDGSTRVIACFVCHYDGESHGVVWPRKGWDAQAVLDPSEGWNLEAMSAVLDLSKMRREANPAQAEQRGEG